MTLPLARPPTFKWCRRPHRLSALLHSPCARQVSPFVFSFWFVYPFSHILIICLPNHTNSYSQFNEHPSCSSLPPQVWPGKKVCSFKHNSHVRAMYWYFFSPPPACLACQGKTHIVYSPITNSKWQRIFRHSGQICKISGNEFQPERCQSDLQV